MVDYPKGTLYFKCPASGVGVKPFPEHSYEAFKRLNQLWKMVGTFESEEDPALFLGKINDYGDVLKIPLRLIVDNLKRFFKDSKDEEVRDWYEGEAPLVQYWIQHKVPCQEIWEKFGKSFSARFKLIRFRDSRQPELDALAYEEGMSTDKFMAKLIKILRQIDPKIEDYKIIREARLKLPEDAVRYTMMAAPGDSVEVFQDRLREFWVYQTHAHVNHNNNYQSGGGRPQRHHQRSQ